MPMFEINMSTPKTSRAGTAAQALHRDDLTLLDTTSTRDHQSVTVDTSSITATDDASVTIDGEQQGDKDEENSSKKGHVHRRKRQRGDFLGHTLTIGKGVIRQEHKLGGSAIFARSRSQD